MTDYFYDMDLVVDPLNPANVVANGQVSIYDPADTSGSTLLALKDPSGLPLPNPLTSNANGFLPPRIATVPQTMWKSGGFTGYFNSYKGLRDEAVGAVSAAQSAANSASSAANEVVTTAAVDGTGALVLTKASGATVNAGNVKGQKGDKGDKGDKGLDGSNVLPTDDAIKQAINDTASATRGALNATYVPKWKANTAYLAGDAVLSPSGDTVTAKANFTSGASYSSANWNASATYAQFTAKDQQALETRRAAALRPFHRDLSSRDWKPTNVVVIGDSITEGGGSTAMNRRWIDRFQAALRARFPVAGVAGGVGYRPVAWSSASNPMAQPTSVTTGSPVLIATDFGWGKKCFGLTSGQSVSWSVTGTSVDVLYARGSSSGVMGVSVDGGAVTTVATLASGGTNDTGNYRLSLGAAGTHTVKVEWSSGGTVYVEGIHVYNGDENAGIRVTESGHWGWQSLNWSQGSTTTLKYTCDRIEVLSPSLVVLALGINDAGNNINPATMKTNLQTTIAAIKARLTTPTYFPANARQVCFLLVAYYERQGTGTYPWSDYLAQYQAIADADPSVAFFDLTKRIPAYNTDGYLWAPDGVHPNDETHGVIADAVAGFISPR